MQCTLGVDIGTSSSKGVLVDERGVVLATATRQHEVSRPQTGWVEMDPELWWAEFLEISTQLQKARPDATIAAVGVSGMGPCVLLTDEKHSPIRQAILYGVDTRASAQITQLNAELGEENIVRIGGSRLSSQSAGPKILWVSAEEPELWKRAKKFFMPASWIVFRLTGSYVLDHQSASQTSPFYDIEAESWYKPWWDKYAPNINLPKLYWADHIAGIITPEMSTITGIPSGVPVIVGTIDAWSEAVSVGAHGLGDLMLMYGTTMFLIATGEKILRTPSMWTTAGAFAGTRQLAGGLSTSGALTEWIKNMVSADYPTLIAEAEKSNPGSLLMLPYFAGERTPIQDPDARGIIVGLTLSHTRGDIYRAALEATALGIKHNIDTMQTAGADISRVVAVGGGTQAKLWLQIVSDITGYRQEIPKTTIGASYGSAFLAARAISTNQQPPLIKEWNPIVSTITPNPKLQTGYARLFDQYLRLYHQTRDIVHELVADHRQ